MTDYTPTGYQVVAAGQTDKALGAGGATQDYLSHIVIQPAVVGASVVVKDGTAVIYTLTAGTLADLSGRTVPFGIKSNAGGFKVTTSANCVVLAVGTFT